MSPDTIDQVHGVLAKLQGAIAAGEDRNRLLEIVARLQEDLVVDSNQGRKPNRFSKRRNRKSRHTVGVTKEELDDARKFIENMNFPLHMRNDEMAKEVSESIPYVLQKQGSLGTLLANQYGNNTTLPQSPVKNSTPQPFNLGGTKNNDGFIYPEVIDNSRGGSGSISYHNAASKHRKANPIKHQAPADISSLQNHSFSNKQRPILQESVSLDSGVEVSPKPLSKLPSHNIESQMEPDDMSEEEEINKLAMIKPHVNGKISPKPQKPHTVMNNFNNYHKSPPFAQNSNSNLMKFGNFYKENLNVNVENSNKNGVEKPSQNRFMNKKIKMKRANTIDIPKPLHCYQMESDDDENSPNAVKPKIPQFTPKTDNYRKFLAFIQKHNNNEGGPVWSQNNISGSRNAGCNWKSCFGSIKNVFEGSNDDNSSRSSSMSSAKKFWKASDDSLNIPKPSSNAFSSKFSKAQPVLNNFTKAQTTNNFPKAQSTPNNFAKPQPPTIATNLNKTNSKVSSMLPWKSEVKDDVVSASLTVPGIPIITNTVPSGKVIKPIPKPLPVNQFSHAPMSAFKPLPKKTSIVGVQPQIWSPPSMKCKDAPPQDDKYEKTFSDLKSNFVTAKPPMQKSPVNTCVPWAWNNTAKESRVMNLASSRFEKTVPNDNELKSIPPYREKSIRNETESAPSKRYSVPQTLPPSGALSAPNLVRKLDNLKHQLENEHDYPNKIDTERLQIEFYEKQIRENNKKKSMPVNGLPIRRFSEQIPSPEYTYTVTDYTPPHISTFVPLPQIPDIEETKPTPLKKLPDLVLNNVSKPSRLHKSPISTSLENLSHINKRNSSINPDIEDFEKPIKDNNEFKAVSKVMKGPVSQQAVIKTKNTQETYEQRDTAAKSLKGVLQKFSSPKHDVITQMERKKATKADGQQMMESNKSKQGHKDIFKSKPSFSSALQNNTPNHSFQVYNVSNDNNANIGNTVIPKLKCNNVSLESKFVDSLKYPPSPDVSHVISPRTMFTQPTLKSAYNTDSYALSDKGESIINSKLHFPINKANVVMSPTSSPEYCHIPSPYALSKSESWHQLTQQTALKPPSPRISPGSKAVSRAKSMHLLAVPKQFEAGISKDKVYEKKKTVEAYFSGQVSPNPLSKSSSQSAVNENTFQKSCESFKTSTKLISKNKNSSSSVRTPIESYGLGRSQTMPHISFAELALLDEDNVEDAFDDLFNESS